MTSKVADSIRRGLEEALAYAEGAPDARDYGVYVPNTIDVKSIRTKLDMTQGAFAATFGFGVDASRHREQGRRVPEGPARAYFLVHRSRSRGGSQSVQSRMTAGAGTLRAFA